MAARKRPARARAQTNTAKRKRPVVRRRVSPRLQSKESEPGEWIESSVQDFLGLSDEEVLVIEVRLALARAIRERRARGRVRQADLARKLGTTQPRVAKIESGKETSLDSLIEALAALGATRKEVARVIADG